MHLPQTKPRMKMRTGRVAVALLAVAARSSTVQASPSLRASHLQMKDVDILSSCHSPAPGVDEELKTTSFVFTITQTTRPVTDKTTRQRRKNQDGRDPSGGNSSNTWRYAFPGESVTLEFNMPVVSVHFHPSVAGDFDNNKVTFIAEDLLDVSVILDTTDVTVGTAILASGGLFQSLWAVPECTSDSRTATAAYGRRLQLANASTPTGAPTPSPNMTTTVPTASDTLLAPETPAPALGESPTSSPETTQGPVASTPTGDFTPGPVAIGFDDSQPSAQSSFVTAAPAVVVAPFGSPDTPAPALGESPASSPEATSGPVAFIPTIETTPGPVAIGFDDSEPSAPSSPITTAAPAGVVAPFGSPDTPAPALGESPASSPEATPTTPVSIPTIETTPGPVAIGFDDAQPSAPSSFVTAAPAGVVAPFGSPDTPAPALGESPAPSPEATPTTSASIPTIETTPGPVAIGFDDFQPSAQSSFVTAAPAGVVAPFGSPDTPAPALGESPASSPEATPTTPVSIPTIETSLGPVAIGFDDFQPSAPSSLVTAAPAGMVALFGSPGTPAPALGESPASSPEATPTTSVSIPTIETTPGPVVIGFDDSQPSAPSSFVTAAPAVVVAPFGSPDTPAPALGESPASSPETTPGPVSTPTGDITPGPVAIGFDDAQPSAPSSLVTAAPAVVVAPFGSPDTPAPALGESPASSPEATPTTSVSTPTGDATPGPVAIGFDDFQPSAPSSLVTAAPAGVVAPFGSPDTPAPALGESPASSPETTLSPVASTATGATPGPAVLSFDDPQPSAPSSLVTAAPAGVVAPFGSPDTRAPTPSDGGDEDDYDCAACSSLSNAQVEALASYDNGGKRVVCDVDCLSSSPYDVASCNCESFSASVVVSRLGLRFRRTSASNTLDFEVFLEVIVPPPATVFTALHQTHWSFCLCLSLCIYLSPVPSVSLCLSLSLSVSLSPPVSLSLSLLTLIR
ncbi:unnamed protein product [Ectocarpus sp. 4 AP-2014]